MPFKKIISVAEASFDAFSLATKITFSKKGYTIYGGGHIVLKFCKLTPELEEAFRINGDKNFTLTRLQVKGCFWDVK